MLLGNLIRNTTVQGNVRLSVWKGNEETAVEYFHDVDDLANEPCRLMAWLPIKYIFCPGERVIRFELEPYDDEAIRLLGKFYSHGTYGGVGFLTAPIYKRKNENWSKTEAIEYAKAHGNEAAYNLLLLGGPDFYDGDYNEYTELLEQLESK